MADTVATYPSLKDVSVLVTGGASGIGADIVRGFAGQCAKVTFIDVDETSGLALEAELADGAHPAHFICADLLKFEAFDELVMDITNSQGPPTVLVNNASHDQRHEIGSVTRKDWDWSLSINLGHFFFMAQAVLPGMQAAGKGSIVNMASVTGINGSPALPAYSAAKGAIITLTKTLARKYGGDGIRCNAVAPGAVVTPRQARLWVSPEKQKEFVARQLLHAPVTEVDIADAVLFLASDQAKSITKQILVVDGGLI